MQQAATETMTGYDTTTITLVVRWHQGVLLHVCSLIARRNFRMEGLRFIPGPEVGRARIEVEIGEKERLQQVVRQLEKLEDVIEVECPPLEVGEEEREDEEELVAV